VKNSSAKQAGKSRRQFFDIYILFSKLRGIKTILEKKDNEFQR